MGIDTPSDEFYTINTNQSGPPMSARHKLQLRLLRSNPNSKPNTFPKKPARQKMDWSYLLARTYLQTFESRGQNCFTKIQCGSYSKVQVVEKFAETNFVNDLHEDTQRNSPSSNEDDEFQECQEYNTDQDLEPHIMMICWIL